jgi:nucleoside-diphosphate-sugar epimerase
LEEISSGDPRLELITGNLVSPGDVARMLDGVEVVYHLAFGMKGGPAEIFLNGVVAGRRLLEGIARNPGIRRIVLVSSFAVYGTADQRRGALIDERFPLEQHPEIRDPYSYGKARAEALFRAFREQDGRDLVIVRPGVVYGPGGPPISTRVGIRFGSLFMHFGGGNKLPLTYVTNCAEAIVLAGENAAADDIVNVVA